MSVEHGQYCLCACAQTHNSSELHTYSKDCQFAECNAAHATCNPLLFLRRCEFGATRMKSMAENSSMYSRAMSTWISGFTATSDIPELYNPQNMPTHCTAPWVGGSTAPPSPPTAGLVGKGQKVSPTTEGTRSDVRWGGVCCITAT